jgi:GAF domain-containing protein
MLVSQLTRLLSAPPGDLVYHLVVLFALEAVLLLARGLSRRSDAGYTAVRVTFAAIVLLVLRAAMVVVALMGTTGIVNAAWFMPPLERLAAFAGLGLLGWALLPLLHDYVQAGLVLVALTLGIGLVLYAIYAPQWYAETQIRQTFYNATPADLVWTVLAVVLSLLATVAALTRRRAQWAWLSVIFGLVFLGNLMHLLDSEPQSHVAGWVRLSELCAYPLLVGLMLTRAAEREPVAPALPAAIAAAAPWAAIEGCLRVAEAGNVTVSVQRAAVAVSNVLNTDVLAIGLLNAAGDAVDLAAVCRAGASPRAGPTFDVASQPPVQSAINRRRAAPVGGDQESYRATLAALVGGANGPLWIQPLIHQHAPVGVLIAGRAVRRDQPGWTASEKETLNGLCDVLAGAIAAAQANGELARQVDALTQQARDQEAALAQAQAKAQQLGAQLAQAEAQKKRTPVPSAPRASPATDLASPEIGLPPAGEKTLRVRVRLDGNSPLKSARAMMVLAHVKRVGRIVACLPVEADLRSGGFRDEFTVTCSTASDPSSVRTALAAIRDVTGVEVQVV